MADRQYSLLMASLVAIVAIVGLVTHFSGSATGAYNMLLYNTPVSSPHSYPLAVGVDPAFYEYGYNTAAVTCTQVANLRDSDSCCNQHCADYCEGKDPVVGMRTVSECLRQCELGCDMGRKDIVSTA